jgi:ribonuclease HI
MHKRKSLSIFCDGGSRGNPGASASAFVVYTSDGVEVTRNKKFIGTATNNVAEYTAVLRAHRWLHKNAEDLRVEEVSITLDSELVAKQLTGVYKIKSPHLAPLAAEILKIQKALHGITIKISHTLRAGNKVADALVNQTLDENLS